jgi:hypothetical protein
MDVGTVKQTVESHIESEAALFKGLDGQVYARFKLATGLEVVPIDAPRFEEWLTQHCLENWIPANRSAIRSAVVSVKARRWAQLDPVRGRIALAPDRPGAIIDHVRQLSLVVLVPQTTALSVSALRSLQRSGNEWCQKRTRIISIRL